MRWHNFVDYLLIILDIAIGCPFGGDDQQGLVLIYNGHASGLKDTPTQALAGQWATGTFPASFGYALRGEKDLDQNGYPGKILESNCSVCF